MRPCEFGITFYMKNMVLMIDNYDSFTWNVVQYLGELKADVKVIRNDELSVDEIIALAPERIVISPGPCTPTEAGVSLEVITRLAGKLPILGVCLGHQSIGQALGGKVVRARQVMHGKVSPIYHNGKGVFANLPSPFNATRYHSLIIEKNSLPDCLEITAWTQQTTVAWMKLWVCGIKTLFSKACSFIQNLFSANTAMHC